MIRQLGAEDQAAAVALLSQAPYLNLYLLGNVASLGMVHPASTFWGDFVDSSDAAALRGVVNLYMTGWSVFGRPDADWVALAAVIDRHPTAADRLQDNPGGTPSIMPYVQGYETVHFAEHQLMALERENFQAAAIPEAYTVRRATWEDFEALAAFYADAEDMSRVAAAVERPLRDRRIWLAERDGEILACALTNAETADQAMIGGVFTRPKARNFGLGRAVCGAMCEELLGEQRRPLLYWDNPAAGAVYRRLGFHQIDTWRSLRIRRRVKLPVGGSTTPET